MSAITIECPCCKTVWALAQSGYFTCNKCGQKIEVVAQPPPLPSPPPIPPEIVRLMAKPPTRARVSLFNIVAAVLVVFIGVSIFYTVFTATSSMPASVEAKASDQPDFIKMQVAAERAIKQRLKAPSTAKFPGMFEQSAYKLAKTASGTYILKGWVDAQNGFGAMIRSDWYVEFRHDAAGLEVLRAEIADQ